MKLYSLLALLGFFLVAKTSEINPDETAAPVDSAPAAVPGSEETQEESTPASRRERRKKARKEENTSDDEESNDAESEDSDL